MCLGLRTLLGIAVGSCGASGNTLYWVLLVHVVPQATHFAGYCCWFMRGLGQHIPPYTLPLHSMGTPTARYFKRPVTSCCVCCFTRRTLLLAWMAYITRCVVSYCDLGLCMGMTRCPYSHTMEVIQYSTFSPVRQNIRKINIHNTNTNPILQSKSLILWLH
jgi:hypothetical protein